MPAGLSIAIFPNLGGGYAVGFAQNAETFEVHVDGGNTNLSLNGHQFLVDNQVFVGVSASTPSSLSVNGAGSLVTRNLRIGLNSGASGTLTVAGAGSLDVGSILTVGLATALGTTSLTLDRFDSATGNYSVIGGGSVIALPTVIDLIGDANFDGTVNALDFNALATNFGLASGATVIQGDFNGDGAVNTSDFALLALHFNESTPSGPALGEVLPEPGSCGLLGSFLMLALPRKGKRFHHTRRSRGHLFDGS